MQAKGMKGMNSGWLLHLAEQIEAEGCQLGYSRQYRAELCAAANLLRLAVHLRRRGRHLADHIVFPPAQPTEPPQDEYRL